MRRARTNKSASRIREIDYDEYRVNARRWKQMGALVAPSEAAKAAGAFAIVNGNEWLVFVG